MALDFSPFMDKQILRLMNRRIPATLETTYQQSLPFAAVMAHTAVNQQKTAVTQLAAPGRHTIHLNTPGGEMTCQVLVHLAPDPAAPLLIYHHGLGEYPYDSSWRRLFRQPLPLAMHRVLIQAPYHTSWTSPLAEGFHSLQNIYQMLAGSLRLMELVQDYFEAQMAAYTVLAGVSWGGITSMIYAGLVGRVAGVVPMLSSPNIAQAIWDITDLVRRPLQISRYDLFDRLDFTTVYEQIYNEHVYPLLGKEDMFFLWENHARLFEARPLITVPGSHISNLWRIEPLQRHLYQSLARIADAR